MQPDNKENNKESKMESDYSKRELDHMFKDIKNQLNRIEDQTIRHNARLTKVERYLLIVGCVTGTVFFLNGNEFILFIKTLL